MSEESKELMIRQCTAFSGPAAFESAQRMAKALVTSSMVPEAYRGGENLGNAIIALEIAQRMDASPLMIMQNLHIIEGRPSWSSPFIISAVNSCGRFSPLHFRMTDHGEKMVQHEYWEGPKGQRTKRTGTLKINDRSCVAWAYEKGTEDILEGPPASLEMAIKEGWYTKNGSKWVTMPELMLRYRAAAFFGRLYAPDILMGMHTEEEIEDISAPVDITKEATVTRVVPDLFGAGEDKQPQTVEPSDSQTGGMERLGADVIEAVAGGPQQREATTPATAPTRKRGEPSPGHVKRTKKEMEEDRLADEADKKAAAEALSAQNGTVQEGNGAQEGVVDQGSGVVEEVRCAHPVADREWQETGDGDKELVCLVCGEILPSHTVTAVQEPAAEQKPVEKPKTVDLF